MDLILLCLCVNEYLALNVTMVTYIYVCLCHTMNLILKYIKKLNEMLTKDDEQEGNRFVVIQNLTKCNSKNEYF